MNHIDKDKKIADLQAEIETLKTIIYNMPGNVWWNDVHGNYLGCNFNQADIFNLKTPEEFIGKNPFQLVNAEIATKIATTDAEIIRTKKEVRVEEKGWDMEGKVAYYLSHKLPLFDKYNNVKAILGISFDITERTLIAQKLSLAKKKAEAANRAKSEFLALISHELRTPLTSILGFVNFLAEENLSNEKKKTYIQHISSSGTYLLALINNLLDYSKLKSHKINLSNAPINLKSLSEDVLSILSSSAKLKNLSLSLIYDHAIPALVEVDGQALRQILINLVGNAIKFTDAGKVQLKMHCVETKNKSVKIKIVVKDSGIGIPGNELKAIFKQFYQLENVYTRSKSWSGTGLGLTIVKKLVEHLGGSIKVISKPNKGSTFIITLKFKRSDTVKKVIVNSIPAKPNVLLVEDDRLIQIIHKQMLEELNCHIQIADCAISALRKLDDKHDILFVDIGLPDINGFELIKTIRNQFNDYEDIPIIALTGYSEEDERKQCIEAGANEVMIKPVSKAALGNVLERYL